MSSVLYSYDHFFETMQRGDLALAGNNRASKSHILRLNKQAINSRGAREETSDSPSLWSGEGICGTEGAGWFWSLHSPKPNKPMHDSDYYCQSCTRKWERMDRPTIRGVTDAQRPEQLVGGGWTETDPIGHPDDPEYVQQNFIDDPVPRTEIRRFERGHRTVRVVRFEDHPYEYSHGTHYGLIDQPESDEHYATGSMDHALHYAHYLMQQGGYP